MMKTRLSPVVQYIKQESRRLQKVRFIEQWFNDPQGLSPAVVQA